MEHVITIKSLSELESAARDFLAQVGDHRLLAFEAPMGAGKTTFIAALCRVLGVDADAVSSPTFALVNEYRARGGEPVYHFDFYRIEHPSEALDIGFYEYVDSGCLCLMEWPGNIAALLPEETLIVRISVSPDGVRTLSWAD